ncbi:MAG: BatD family protein [Saprospiraceae bacterium]|nr:BatD family protein [Saprospiraceae bacterium]
MMVKGFVFAFSFIWTMHTIAQEQIFRVEIGNDTILEGNPVEVRFTSINLVGKIELPAFAEFQVVAGPNISSSLQIVNGESYRSQSTSYFLLPLESGVATVSPAYFVASDRTWESDDVDITVMSNPNNLKQNYYIQKGRESIGIQSLKKKKKLKVTKI